MVGFVLGLLVFYTANDYLRRQDQKSPASAPASAPASQTAPAQDGATATTSTAATTAITSTTAATGNTSTAAPAAAAKSAPRQNEAPNLQIMDIIFRKWAVNALWDYDTTQVLFYNLADNKFSIPVEVTRRGVEGDYTYFYRPIDALTRPLVPAPDRPDALIRFTENEEATRLREEKFREMWNTR